MARVEAAGRQGRQSALPDPLPAWRAYFPDDYRWSFNTLLALSLAPTGGSEMGEVDQVARRLSSHVGDDRCWFDEWVALADRVRSMAEAAEQAGHHITASSHYKRACCYYFVGERFRLPKDERALAVYRNAVELFQRALRLHSRHRVEAVEVPYEAGEQLPALLVHAEGHTNWLPPVVVFYTGFDGNKELNWFLGIEALVDRGVSCISVDTPGVGEAIRWRELYLRPDYEVAGSAVLDYLATRDDIDVSRSAIMAMSLGGYYAPRTASMEPRFTACVAWGAQWDYHELWRRRIATASPRLPVPAAHLMWSTNADSPEEALRRIEGFRLADVVPRMRCPLLICHGEDDQQVPVEDARRLYDAAGSDDKELRIFTAEEGGVQHCNLDNLAVATPVMFDWLAERLLGDSVRA